MATAGRILIMPKGAWDPTVKYEMLDLLSHGGTAWLAKKTSVGIEPTFDAADYWHPILGADGSFITESDFEAFKNETNEILEKTYTIDNPPTAEQVGAMPITKVTEENVDFNNLINEGIYNVKGANCSHTPADDDETVLLDEIQHGFLRVFKYTSLILQVYTLTNMSAYESRSRRTYIRASSFGSGWTTWKRFGFADEFLQLTGGTLSGLLSATSDIVVNHFTHITGNEETSCLRAIRPGGSSRGIEVVNSSTGIEDKYAARFTTYDGTTWKISTIFGQHNKPHGTFTGNASKTSRTINIGGVHSTATKLFVSGNGYSLVISPNGAFGMHYNTRSIKILLESECKYINGVLTIATDDAAINASGITYHYQLS